jgi:hypothetical protein
MYISCQATARPVSTSHNRRFSHVRSVKEQNRQFLDPAAVTTKDHVTLPSEVCQYAFFPRCQNFLLSLACEAIQGSPPPLPCADALSSDVHVHSLFCRYQAFTIRRWYEVEALLHVANQTLDAGHESCFSRCTSALQWRALQYAICCKLPLNANEAKRVGRSGVEKVLMYLQRSTNPPGAASAYRNNSACTSAAPNAVVIIVQIGH